MKNITSLNKKIANALLLFSCLLSLGCANLAETLFTEQNFVLVDEKVTEDFIPRGPGKGTIYSIPEKRLIRKIRILGDGTCKDIDIYVRVDKNTVWKKVKQIKRKVAFPIEISMVEHTDAVRILPRSMPFGSRWMSTGHIDTVEFYIVVENQSR